MRGIGAVWEVFERRTFKGAGRATSGASAELMVSERVSVFVEEFCCPWVWTEAVWTEAVWTGAVWPGAVGMEIVGRAGFSVREGTECPGSCGAVRAFSALSACFSISRVEVDSARARIWGSADKGRENAKILGRNLRSDETDDFCLLCPGLSSGSNPVGSSATGGAWGPL